MIVFSVSLGCFMLLVGLAAGYTHGKERGRDKEIKNRISRDIIAGIKRDGNIPQYYSTKDIQAAQEYGKKEGFYFTVGDPPPFKVIRGGKR
jgi:hypothetical protein